MRGTVLYGPRDIRFEDRDDPKIEKPTDAVIRMAATCVCVPALAKSTFPRSCVGPHLAPQLCSGNICKAYQNTHLHSRTTSRVGLAGCGSRPAAWSLEHNRDHGLRCRPGHRTAKDLRQRNQYGD